MCAITGIINFEPAVPDEKTIREMTEAVIHRGPEITINSRIVC